MARRAVVGVFESNVASRFGGTPMSVEEESLKPFAKEILPVLNPGKAKRQRNSILRLVCLLEIKRAPLTRAPKCFT